MLGTGAVSTGCAGSGKDTLSDRGTSQALRSPVRTEAVADWNDVEAAVTAALGRTDLVMVRVERPADDRVEFSLWSARDEPGQLVVTRGPRTEGDEAVPLELVCTVGRFGDPSREAELLALVVHRLGQLKGVEVAPLKW